MRIDAHHHVWDLSVRDQPWTANLPMLRRSFAFADLRPSLDAQAIDATVIVQTVPCDGETQEMLALAAHEPRIGGVVGWVELTAPDVPAALAKLRAGTGGPRLVGIRHGVQAETDPRWLCRPEVRRGIAAVGAAGLAYDLLITADQLPAAVETVRDLPSVRFVLDHAGKPLIARGVLDPWREHIAVLGTLPNVAVKLSGLVTEAGDGWTIERLRPYTDELLDAFGPGRIMVGSDWPVCLLAASYGEVLTAADELMRAVSDAERDEIFGGSAAHWYSLG